MKSIKLISPAAFARLSRLNQRVAIARDVIARLDAKNIVPKGGKLVSDRTLGETLDSDLSLKDFINSTPRCEVCAKGALTLAWIGNFNNYDRLDDLTFKVENTGFYSLKSFLPELKDIFGRDLLDAIEAAFENQDYDWSIFKGTKDPNVAALRRHFARIPKAKRMRAIFANVVKNGGVLKVKDAVIR